MTWRSLWILLFCFHAQVVNSETPEELLLALKQKHSQQPDCTPTFDVRHPGYITPDSVAQPTITTDDDCRSSCIKDRTCMSYQIDTRPGQTFCRIQPSYSNEVLQGPFNAENVKEYVFTVKCVNSTGKERCSPLIELRFRNLISHVAVEQPSAKTEMECRAVCVKDQDCMSYQIHRRQQNMVCFVNKHAEMFHKYQLYFADDSREYLVIDRCLDKYDVAYSKDCSPVFKRLLKPNQASKVATPYPLLTMEQLCRMHCLIIPDCVSYQIDRKPGAPFCSIQTNLKNLMKDNLIKADLVTEYILVNPCTNRAFDKSAPDCTPFVFPKPYPGISGTAMPNPEVTSYEGCRALCLLVPICVSYQNSSTGTLCWTLSNWRELLPGNAYPSSTVNEYVVGRRCSKGLPGNPVITFDDYEVNTPETVVEECMPADKRSESDIVFAVCIAGILKRDSKSEERLKALKTFLYNIVISLNVASNKDRIGLVTFEQKAYVEFNLNTYNEPKLITEAIAKVGCHECNATEAGVFSALQTIKKKVLTNSNGIRPDVPHVIIMITDRLSNVDLAARNKLVKDFLAAGTYIIPVGVTDMVEADMLKGFASPNSDGSSQNLLWVNNFVSLNSLVYRIHDAIHDVLPAKHLRLCYK